MNDEELDEEYRKSIASFDEAAIEAVRVSRAAMGRQAGSRGFWASVLFTRLCNSTVSLLVMTPKSRLSEDRRIDHWDFSAIASLIRNLLECYLAFFYLVVDPKNDGEYRFRLCLMQLHDCTSRIRMFRDFDPNYHELPDFKAQTDELRQRLSGLDQFSALPAKRQKQLLDGKRFLHVSQDELITRMNEDVAEFRGNYRFLSAHVHSLPLSFYRMADQDRGRGLENSVEKSYIAAYITFAEKFIRRATAEMIVLFPNN